MSVLGTLPPEPLGDTEIERLRAREEVWAFTVIGTTTVHDRRYNRRWIATSLVVLAEGTVSAFEYDDAGWSREVLQTDADRRDHLERALDRLEGLYTVVGSRYVPGVQKSTDSETIDRVHPVNGSDRQYSTSAGFLFDRVPGDAERRCFTSAPTGDRRRIGREG